MGISATRIEHEIDAGRWMRIAPSVVIFQNGPLIRPQMLWLGVLHGGQDAVLSHLTACETHGLRWTLDPVIHVLTPKGDLVEPLPGFRFRHTRRPYLHWSLAAGRLPARLRVDHAALLVAERDNHLRRAIGLLAATVQQGLTTADRLILASTQICKLRHGNMLKLALGDIAGGAQSFAEIDAVRLCHEAGLRAPDRQTRRRDKTGRWRWLDLEWRLADGRTIVLEVDGSFHMRTEHWWKDQKRERGIVIGGAMVLRCSSIELRLEPDDVMDDLRAAGVPTRNPFVCGRSA